MSEEERKVIWTGHLKRGEEAGTIVGFLHDIWQWRIEITGKLNPDGGYTLEGRTGEVPEALRVPIVDDPVGRDG